MSSMLPSSKQDLYDNRDEFQNIHLGSVSSRELDDIQRLFPLDNLDDTSVGVSDQQQCHSTLSTDHVIESSNEYLNHLSKQLMNDYAKYFHLKPTAQIDELNECIENLLTHMEEFYGLIERIRNESNQCLDQYSLILPKLEEFQKLFSFIDKLGRIVNHVSIQVSLMEQEVSRAEKMMGTKTSTMKKLFSLITHNQTNTISSESSSSNYRYMPPDIFKTDELMKI